MNRRFLLSLVVGLLALAGCSEHADTPLTPQPAAPAFVLGTEEIDLTGVLEFVTLPDLTKNRHAEKWITAAEGGSVELKGFRVDIPPGALPHDALVTIDLPADELLGKHVIAEFGPHGMQFNQPVTITFPLEGVLWTGEPVEGARWENDAWTSLGGSVSANGKEISTTTPHFSTYSGKVVMAGG